MAQNIEAIFLDVGNTLRIVIEDADFQAKAKRDLTELAGSSEPPEQFIKKLEVRWKIYRNWAFETLREASEKELWTRFLLPDYPVDRIAPQSGRLTRLWRDRDGRRVPRHDVKSTIIELSRRGYTLGIIANTITETEIPDWMDADGVTPYFQSVVLSSKYGYRKPGIEIYHEACRRAGVEPGNSVYVGDNPIRDVEGTQKAGFAMSIILMEPEKLAREPITGDIRPDKIIHECGDLLDIFPDRNK
jgi:putative hydrolase of the HAD superfamily